MNDNKPTTVAKAKPGEYVRLVDKPNAPVWVRGEYDRATRFYLLHRFDDINRTTLRAGKAQVFVGFTF